MTDRAAATSGVHSTIDEDGIRSLPLGSTRAPANAQGATASMKVAQRLQLSLLFLGELATRRVLRRHSLPDDLG